MEGADEFKRRTRKELWLEAKARLDKDKKFLEDIEMSEKSRLHLGKLFLPGEENHESAPLISAGPQGIKNQHMHSSKVFLWRNAMKGANFYARYQKLIKKKQT